MSHFPWQPAYEHHNRWKKLTRNKPQSVRRSGLPRDGNFAFKGSPISKRPIPYVKNVIAVASGKGGVGKSTIATNLALSLAINSAGSRPLRVGLLDLDIFGPSIPKLMGLEDADEPELTKGELPHYGHLVPLSNHGIQCMSMGFLLPKSPNGGSNPVTPVVWRGLMVQKATQQLLFDVDWRGRDPSANSGIDVLIVDMPPGTGDVALTFSQLVRVNGAVIVSTPQDISLIDVRKGVSMFRKVSVPILGLVLNMSYYTCPSCSAKHHVFGSIDSFHRAVRELDTTILGELPLVPAVNGGAEGGGSESVRTAMKTIARHVLRTIDP
ncbi:hypothetical protein BS47DRAFT_1370801 [Hydnum rufescens UP504]|uniref:P-loop containing nucleoside triphosphate hydrolase protein n=1 Tax=Hydnum rufescens UP504 TaxID=1448309 RepID=A0A9P6E1F3_9AGAM|nr:hypothetical protein BS47DRAFT_1370801 [Hydnum rufescens UP504]